MEPLQNKNYNYKILHYSDLVEIENKNNIRLYGEHYHENLNNVLKYLDPLGQGQTNRWELIDYKKNPEGTMSCACGHMIEHEHYIYNKYINCRLFVGSVCYRKFINDDTLHLTAFKNKLKGHTICACGCNRKIRETTLEKYSDIKIKYIESCLKKKFNKCSTCKKYEDYNCICIQNMNETSENKTSENKNDYESEDRKNLSVLSTKERELCSLSEEEPEEEIDLNLQEPFGTPEDFKKLNNYVEIDHNDIKTGDHFRYTVNVYRKDHRKTVYGICFDRIEGGTIMVKGYKSKYDPYIVNPEHHYKKFRFYKRYNDVSDKI